MYKTNLPFSSFLFVQVTSPLVDYYASNDVLKTFKGTQSDVIYPEVKMWLEHYFE